MKNTSNKKKEAGSRVSVHRWGGLKVKKIQPQNERNRSNKLSETGRWTGRVVKRLKEGDGDGEDLWRKRELRVLTGEEAFP